MLKSMTGYGKSELNSNSYIYSVEAKSINSKYLDVNIELPAYLEALKQKVAELINNKIARGKVLLKLTRHKISDDHLAKSKLIKEKFLYIKSLGNELCEEISDEKFFELAVSNYFEIPKEKKQEDEELNNKIYLLIASALDNLDKHRIAEGKKLEIKILEYLDCIFLKVDLITPFEKERIKKVEKKLREAIKTNKELTDFDESRLLKEIIYHLQKLDITEEKDRLRIHINYFKTTIKKEKQSGKKLGFILQEILREINTLSSKANNFDIQKICIEMKDNVEKIREQLLNIL